MGVVSGGAGVGAVVLASVVVLAGCVGDPGPIVTRMPSAVASAPGVGSETPSPSPSVMALSDDELLALMPEGAGREDLIGAMVTAQFFLEQYAEMFHTGDTRVWEALSADECGYCADALADAEQVRDEGWVAEGGEVFIDTNQTRGAIGESGTATVVFTANVADAYLTNLDGERTQTGAARSVIYGMELGLQDQVWRVERAASES